MRLLLIASYDPTGILTVREHITQIKNLSDHQIEIYNLRGVGRYRQIVPKLLWPYDGIILHNTVTYDIEHLLGVQNTFLPRLKNFKGLKIVMKQDEMRRVNFCRSLLQDWQIDLLLTCLSPNERDKVYPRSQFPKLSFLHTRTGYVTEAMKTFQPLPYADRTIDVCYRGMETPYEWGRLGYEKFYIGERFRAEAGKTARLRTDISSKNQDRLSGDRWISLLAHSKSALATESGASIFDWTGELESRCRALKLSNPDMTFEKVWKELLHPHEGNVDYAQISPRHLEAAYTRTMQVLFEGRYNDLLHPWKHYVPLKKDFSNFKEVEAAIQDPSTHQSLTENAFHDLILKDSLSYERFVRTLDEAIASISR